jgi:hypothetical protein
MTDPTFNILASGGPPGGLDWLTAVSTAVAAVVTLVALVLGYFGYRGAKRQLQAATNQVQAATNQVRASTYPLLLPVEEQPDPVVEFDGSNPTGTVTVRVRVRNDGEGPAFVNNLWFNPKPVPEVDNSASESCPKIVPVGKEITLTLEVDDRNAKYSMLRETILKEQWWFFTVDYKSLTNQYVNTRFYLESTDEHYGIKESQVLWPGQEDWSTMPYAS